ncbi:Arm DNA-binding domain-containing protein [Pseudomonas protegens]|uniref:Arm DNA-binding domain-containing protein n=1 Tax=Pseudomonas protegens TaxID=380021 RepID=UPI0027750667|nr:Arm DNA-binding domain-containing protein [Pseudomonas protegens]MDP9536535.1 Arm DNA-binding domain-containing protein [Pseudomonas protegens]
MQPNGGRHWRLKYRFLGKEKRLALGVYPEVGLQEARRKRDDARVRVCRRPRWSASSITNTPLNRSQSNGSLFASQPGTRSTPARGGSALSSMS